MPAKISVKLELLAFLSKKKDEICEAIAKLFIPERMWFIIKPAISVFRSEMEFSQSGKKWAI